MITMPKVETIKRYAFLRSHATGYEITFTRSIEYKNLWDEPRTVILSRKTYQTHHPDDMRRFYDLSSRLHNGVPYVDIDLDKSVSFNDWLRMQVRGRMA